MDVVTYVPASVPFPGLESTHKSLREVLRGLSLTDTLFWCARLNQILSMEDMSERTKQEYFLHHFLDSKQINRVNYFAGRYGGADKVLLIFRGQLLELLRWATYYLSDKANDGVTFKSRKTKQSFAKAVLISSQLWSYHVYGEDAQARSRMRSRISFMSAARRAVSSSSGSLRADVVFGRATLLVQKFLCQEWEFEKAFFEATGQSLDDYMLAMCAIYFNYLPVTQDGTVPGRSIIFKLDEIGNQCPHFLTELSAAVEIESQSAEDLKVALWGRLDEPLDLSNLSEFNYAALRSASILEAKDGRRIILDAVSFSERIAVGSLFHVTKNAPNKRFADLAFQKYGDAFERYISFILSSLCRRQRRRRDFSFAAPLLKADSTDEISDAAIIDTTNALLFEAKGKWLKDSAVWSKAEGDYEKSLLEKYDVGLKQLGRAVTGIAEKTIRGVDCTLDQIKTIFPILVVYDSLFDVVGHSEFLNKEFLKRIPECTLGSAGFYEITHRDIVVAPLVIMTSSSVELLETSCKDFDLVEMLSDYVHTFHRSGQSLWEFLLGSTYSRHLRASSLLAGFGLGILEKASRVIFGEYIDDSD